MRVWENFVRSNLFIKAKSWEYWPFGIVQFPAFICYLWLSLRARSFIFFSASNPGISMGGMFGESKYDVLQKIPAHYTPKTILVKLPVSGSTVLKMIRGNGFQFPVIFKPDLGERGFMVKRINYEKEIEDYLEKIKINFLVQELVDQPLEFGVFYTHFPNQEKGLVTSITMKEMLHVIGDGESTLRTLILKKDRAKLQWKSLKVMHGHILDKIFPAGERIELVTIGNHCLGTKFINANYLINEKISETFTNISRQIDGFYFGRFDLRCATIEDLYRGKISIMELNGCGAEPAHVYDPTYSLSKAMREFCDHWQNIFRIAQENHARGVRYISAREALQYYKAFKAASR